MILAGALLWQNVWKGYRSVEIMEKHILEIGSSAFFSKTITEHDIYTYAGVTGDFNPVHVNEEEAKKSI